MNEIKIAAVGDILINGKICMSVKQRNQKKEENVYNFDSIFDGVASILQEADLTIGNLEIPLKGNLPFIKKRSLYTGYPLFNGPEQLACSLKRNGFDFLCTANNHCLDNGITGLQRTLQVLDENQLAHTGTFSTKKKANDSLILDVKGIRVGIIAYTQHTNRIPIPKHMKWAVNRIDNNKIIDDLHQMKKKADLNIICLHFGREYKQLPSQKQIKLVDILLDQGADLILGTHPHVLQPYIMTHSNKFAFYSLGNFISIRLKYNPFTNNGIILQLTVSKDKHGTTKITDMNWIPTWTFRKRSKKGMKYFILPNMDTLITSNIKKKIPLNQQVLMNQMRNYTSKLMKPFLE